MTSKRGTRPGRDLGMRVLVTIVLCIGTLMGAKAIFSRLAALKTPPEKSDNASPSLNLRTRTLVLEDFRETLVGYAGSQARREGRIAAEVAARVEWISPRFESGAAVGAEEDLIRLDATELRSQLKQGEARVARLRSTRARSVSDLESFRKQRGLAERELELTRRELERWKKMERGAASSESSVDQQRLLELRQERALLDFERSMENERFRQGELDQQITEGEEANQALKRDVGRCRIVAPHTGVLSSREVRLGERMSPGQVLGQVIDPEAIVVAVDLPAGRHGDVKVGATVRLLAHEGAKEAIEAQVSRIAPKIRSEARSFRVFVDLEGAQARSLPPGAFLVAEIEGPLHRGVFVLPRIALRDGGVFVVEARESGEEEQARFQKLSLRRALADRALVEPEGLSPGDRVAITNVARIADGSRVVALPAEEGADR